jgi:hypothetical protein
MPAPAIANLRLSVIVSIGLGLVAVVVLGLAGHLAMGLFGCLGLALGALNSRMVQRSVVHFGASERPNKKSAFTRSVLVRLAGITLVAVGCALLVRPDGFGAIIGVGLFQMLMLVFAAVPVFRELRRG